MAHNLVISQFVKATSCASPEQSIEAPITKSDPDGYDFLDVLRTYAEHQTASPTKDYFSFSRWNNGHDEYHHDGTTCVTLEYKADAAAKVRATLPELGFSAYEIETRNGRSNTVLFAFPVSEPLDPQDTTRAASLIAEALSCTGLINHSFLYTYFFRFRQDAKVAFHQDRTMSRNFIKAANEEGIFVELRKWMR